MKAVKLITGSVDRALRIVEKVERVDGAVNYVGSISNRVAGSMTSLQPMKAPMDYTARIAAVFLKGVVAPKPLTFWEKTSLGVSSFCSKISAAFTGCFKSMHDHCVSHDATHVVHTTETDHQMEVLGQNPPPSLPPDEV